MMNHLNNLKDSVDRQMEDITMGEPLKERVRQGITQARSQPGRKPFYRRRGLVAGFALACACLALLLVYAPRPADNAQPTMPATEPEQGQDVRPTVLKSIEVKAQQEAAGGVSVSTAFVIETGQLELTAETVAQSLSITPAIDYDLTAGAQGQFLLTPQTPLEKGTVYKIALTALAASQQGQPEDQAASTESGQEAPAPAQLTWAFQTEGDMQLVSTLPTDGSSWVDVQSGIELVFSRSVSDVQGAVSISPAAEGRFEYYDRTVVFVPTQPLKADTLYTVTIEPGLAAHTGETLGDGHSFSFRTASGDGQVPSFYLSGRVDESFLTGDPVVVELLSDSYDVSPIAVDVSLYALSREEYSQLADRHTSAIHRVLGRSTDHLFDTSGRQALTSFGSQLQMGNYRYYVVLPETPQVGFYLVDIRPSEAGTMTNEAVQKLVCVSDLSVWAQSLDGQTLVWVNDSATGLPLEQARLEARLNSGGTAQAESDEQGLALLDTGDATAMTLHITAGEQQWAGQIALQEATEVTAGERYQACLYFDRGAYLPSDTIHFWGVVRARDGSSALPESLSLQWSDLPEQQLALSESGVFTGQVSFENLVSTWLSVQLMVGEDSLAWAGLQVMEYTKPTYVLDVTADRTYYRPGEQASLAVEATFFDGTPAAGLAIQVDGAHYTTDTRGRLSHTLSAPASNARTWVPIISYTFAHIEGQEDANAYGQVMTYHFRTDYMQRFEVEEIEGGWQLSADTHQIDYAAVDAWLAEPQNILGGPGYDEVVAGAAYSQAMTVNVTRTDVIRRETGEIYDFINKQMRKTYTYDYVDTLVDTIELATQGTEPATLDLPYQSTPTAYYTLEIGLTTPDGVALSYQLSLGTSGRYYGSEDYRHFNLVTDSTRFRQGETIRAKLNEYGTDVEGGQLLYTVSQKGMDSWAVTGSGAVEVLCEREAIPNFILSAAYFDGQHVYPVSGLYCYYDYTERALDITITPHKASYAPGETATVTVQAAEADGRPAVAAELVLSVVDEAAFAVAEQYTDILASLYTSAYHRYPSGFASYVQHSMEQGAYAEEGGEGDASGLRQEFVDTAHFITARTGADGTATMRFDLPDNLTSWRLTAAAVSPDGSAGMSKANISATLPFFVNTVYSSSYVYGDEVVLSARGAGVSISGGDRVVYQASLTGTGLSDTLSAQLSAEEYAVFNFGKLPLGDYTIELTAQCGELRDAVRYEIQVSESRLEIPVTEVHTLDGLASLTSQRYPVTLTFVDSRAASWMTAAYTLAGQSGSRADQRLARAAVSDTLARLDSELRFDRGDVSGVQLYDGGVALFSYSQADAGLTATALAACPQLIDTKAAKSWLYTVLYNRDASRQAVAYAYMGLAACGEPVLLDIRTLLRDNEDLTFGLPLAQGLALLGDTASAEAWYEANVAPVLTAYGDDAAFLDVPTTGDGTYTRGALTAQAAALAASVGHPDSSRLLTYLSRTGTMGDSSLTVLMALEAMPTPTTLNQMTLSYTMDGTKRATALTASDPIHVVKMNESQLSRANFRASGDVTVIVRSIGGADALETAMPAGRATVTRQYESLGGGRVAVHLNVAINTSLDAGTDQLYQGYYSLTDVLPSGLRYLSSAYRYDSGWHVSGEEQGRVSISLNTNRYGEDGQTTQRGSFDITYYARAALPGEYVAESAVLQHPATGGVALSQRGSYTVVP